MAQWLSLDKNYLFMCLKCYENELIQDFCANILLALIV